MFFLSPTGCLEKPSDKCVCDLLEPVKICMWCIKSRIKAFLQRLPLGGAVTLWMEQKPNIEGGEHCNTIKIHKLLIWSIINYSIKDVKTLSNLKCSFNLSWPISVSGLKLYKLYAWAAKKKRYNLLDSINKFSYSVYLGGSGIFRSIIIPAHTQHVLHAVVELWKAIKLAVAVVNRWLVDAAQGRLGVIGSVEERLENPSALVEVSRPPKVEPLRRRSDLIQQVGGETRVQQGRLGCFANMLTQESKKGQQTKKLTLVALSTEYSKTIQGGWKQNRATNCASHLFRAAVFRMRFSSYLWRAAFPPKPRKVDT